MDDKAIRNGKWMLGLGVLLLVIGAFLLPMAKDQSWGYYFGSPQQNGLLLMGLGILTLMVGAMNLHGGLSKADRSSPGGPT